MGLTKDDYLLLLMSPFSCGRECFLVYTGIGFGHFCLEIDYNPYFICFLNGLCARILVEKRKPIIHVFVSFLNNGPANYFIETLSGKHDLKNVLSP